MRIRSFAFAVITLAALLVGACTDSRNDQAGRTTSAPSTPPSSADAHNPADMGFAQNMIQHHQQAIEMSDILLSKQRVDPRVVDLANQIKAAQSPEVQQMQTWLNQWGMSTMPSMPGMTPDHGGMPGHTTMPGHSGVPAMGGMMSEEDMAALRNAQGVEASKLFLTQMIQHHRGAITMAQNEIESGQYPAAISVARSIVSSQQQEIDTMQTILASL
ncbi:hypothetical protein I546_2683 [Mycobacterium kansasii 732]|uniref:DUF305 domain-containing protein n=1 Tax=Mycobacterium pseudokansasii TaxID=2341080 RepID=A0A498QSR8_9MYCO|nr:DUF305 domain-containing protein [Mycobacterium pseudokansasii]EUA12026.1 hypothetical protein I546_2683 [Mycobacterium kansasii 732]MBY0389924.1 DUF305 domain-containing protein [Mycobacterium pseudokansasii]VAZ93764.1 hypothetical protein LAUMK35_02418 [Mycobacterium pseudokansasii]VAZ94758.1 hypothetical protein LAUMK21_02419 [Mycobacterium pseudokansasii]VBA49994.1 hypothetical protein LAUMK142_02311 [Mycobacterium pseudokansasii]